MKSQKELVKKVVRYIEENLENELDLDKIAEYAGYSKFHLNRMFTSETGLTIYKYLQSRRLTVAALKLVETKAPISQIAYEAGYQSQQAFSLAFKQEYLYSPKMYRVRGIFTPKQETLYLSTCLRLCQAAAQNNVIRNEVKAA